MTIDTEYPKDANPVDPTHIGHSQLSYDMPILCILENTDYLQ